MRKRKGFNEYKILDDYAVFYIINRKGEKYEVQVDKEDIQRLIDFNYSWTLDYKPCIHDYYVRCTQYLYQIDGKSKNRTWVLHRFVTNAGKNEVVDHRDHNGLNNRKSNLRVTVANKNSSNRKGANKNSGTGHRNVNWGWNREFYFVQFMRKGERFCWEFPLDKFDEACEFADKKRVELFGEFAGNP